MMEVKKRKREREEMDLSQDVKGRTEERKRRRNQALDMMILECKEKIGRREKKEGWGHTCDIKPDIASIRKVDPRSQQANVNN